MMVVVAIVMILTGTGAVALNNFNNNQKLEGAKGELIADLKLARNMAITSQLPEGETGTLDYIRITISGGMVNLNKIWINSGGGSNSDQYFSKSNEVVNDISSSFGFSVENGRLTDGNGNMASSSLCLTLYLDEDNSDQKYVEINSSGLIYEKANCP